MCTRPRRGSPGQPRSRADRSSWRWFFRRLRRLRRTGIHSDRRAGRDSRDQHGFREGPKYKFPAASEDVAAVYKQPLKDHAPQNIGIYGCSAGGMPTAMSVAWFEKHNLPQPGAVGMCCSGAGSPTGIGFGGDANYTAMPLGGARSSSAQTEYSIEPARRHQVIIKSFDRPLGRAVDTAS